MSIICQRILLIFCKFYRLSSEEWGVRNYGIALRRWLFFFGQICHAAKSLRSLRIYICSGRGWAVQILYSDMGFVWYMALVCFLHFNLHLVGLRRMRLCLKLRQGFALYTQWVSPLDPDQGRVPGPFARFARCWVLYFVWHCHSSLLTPHLTPLLT